MGIVVDVFLRLLVELQAVLLKNAAQHGESLDIVKLSIVVKSEMKVQI